MLPVHRQLRGLPDVPRAQVRRPPGNLLLRPVLNAICCSPTAAAIRAPTAVSHGNSHTTTLSTRDSVVRRVSLTLTPSAQLSHSLYALHTHTNKLAHVRGTSCFRFDSIRSDPTERFGFYVLCESQSLTRAVHSQFNNEQKTTHSF